MEAVRADVPGDGLVARVGGAEHLARAGGDEVARLAIDDRSGAGMPARVEGGHERESVRREDTVQYAHGRHGPAGRTTAP